MPTMSNRHRLLSSVRSWNLPCSLISSFHEKLYNRCSAYTTPVAPAAPPRHRAFLAAAPAAGAPPDDTDRDSPGDTIPNSDTELRKIKYGAPGTRRPEPGGRNHVQTVGNVGPAVVGLEIMRIAGTDPDEGHRRIVAPGFILEADHSDRQPGQHERRISHNAMSLMPGARYGSDLASMLSPCQFPGKFPEILEI